jgi:hypothetical protein
VLALLCRARVYIQGYYVDAYERRIQGYYVDAYERRSVEAGARCIF